MDWNFKEIVCNQHFFFPKMLFGRRSSRSGFFFFHFGDCLWCDVALKVNWACLWTARSANQPGFPPSINELNLFESCQWGFCLSRFLFLFLFLLFFFFFWLNEMSIYFHGILGFWLLTRLIGHWQSCQFIITFFSLSVQLPDFIETLALTKRYKISHNNNDCTFEKK